MYEFLDRLISIALPRVQGLPGRVPQRGSTDAATTRWGFPDQLMFIEIDYMKVDQVAGDEHLRGDHREVPTKRGGKLLQLMGMPFRTN